MTLLDSPSGQGAFGIRGHLGRLGRLVRKELNEILRDRRTIITLVLMPVLLYPLLSIAFQQFLLASQVPDERPEYRIGFVSNEEARLVIATLAWKEDKGTNRFVSTRVDPVSLQSKPQVISIPEPLLVEGFTKRIWEFPLDLGVRIRNLAELKQADARPQGLELELIYGPESARGLEVLKWMESQCARANVRILRAQVERLAHQELPVPLETIRAPAKNPEQKAHNFLAALVPLILILMTITGAVYPAIDLTAGERERGTLEILVAAPVPRLGLLFAKHVTVFTVAVLTALVNLVMMTATLLATGLGPQLFGTAGLSALVVVEIFGLLLLLATFFSAGLLALTSFARSFKEAQAYLIPVMVVSFAIGMLGMVSGLKLTGLLPVAPLINIVLLARDLFNGEAAAGPAVAVVLSTLLYALAALAAAARIFGAEGVLYSEQGSWADLFRRPTSPRATATVSAALLCVALMFPVYFVLNGWIGQMYGLPLGFRIGLLVGATVLMFGAIPLSLAAWGRVDLKTGFRLVWTTWATWPFFLGAALLGLSLWPFVLEIGLAFRSAGLEALGKENKQLIDLLIRQWRQLSPLAIVAAYAVVPAVLEELFFRGYLFSALRARLRPLATILTTAFLFGLFHIVASFDRLLPSTLLGVVLGWVCWRTGSVFPGMVLHGCHNTFIVLIAYYQEAIKQSGFDPDQSHVPPTWLAAAALCAGLGAFLIAVVRHPKKPAEAAPR
jgi:ABC-2 type transport system permease protein/sodium transport system permease protein